MHEMGIAMQVMNIALESVPSEMAGAKIERVNLKVGKLAAVVPSSLRFCFEIIAKETALAGAELSIQEVPVTAKCESCGLQWRLDAPVFTCPSCESGSVKMLSGRELEITSIEIEDEE